MKHEVRVYFETSQEIDFGAEYTVLQAVDNILQDCVSNEVISDYSNLVVKSNRAELSYCLK